MTLKAWLDGQGRWQHLVWDREKDSLVVDTTRTTVPRPQAVLEVDKLLNLCNDPAIQVLSAYERCAGQPHPLLLPAALLAGRSGSRGHDDLPLMVRLCEHDSHRCQSQARTTTAASPCAGDPAGIVWVKGPSQKPISVETGKTVTRCQPRPQKLFIGSIS